MDYLRVEIPVIQIKSLRKAEPGEELAMQVYSRDDNLLAESGDEISSDDLDRFRNFRVRSLTVFKYQERWIPGDRESNLPPRAQVLSRENFSDAIAEIVDSLQGRESLKYLVEMIQYLRRVATRYGRDDRKQQLDKLMDQAKSVREQYNQLQDELEDLDDGAPRDRIKQVLYDSSASMDQEFMNLPVDKGLLKKVINASNDRLEVIAPLIDIANDLANEMGIDQEDLEIPVPPFPENYQPAIRKLNQGKIHAAVDSFPEEEGGDWKADLHHTLTTEREQTDRLLERLENEIADDTKRSPIVDAINGEESINPRVLNTLIPGKPDLIAEVTDLLEARVENRDQFWNILNDVSDQILAGKTEKHVFMDVTGQPPESNKNAVLPAQDDLEQARELKKIGEYLDAVQHLLESVRERGGARSNLEGELMVYGEDFEQLLSRREQLEMKIGQQVDDKQQQDVLMNLLNERQDYKPDQLLNIDVDMILLEDIDTYKSEEMKKLEQFDQYFEELYQRQTD